MSHVTFETAVKLKEAGFPQPEVAEFNQIWYGHNNPDPIQIAHEEQNLRGTRNLIAAGQVIGQWSIILAPTATDILLELSSLVLSTVSEKDEHGNMQMLFSCYDPGVKFSQHYHANPAEAAALAYLETQK